jgi:hypothetical protein
MHRNQCFAGVLAALAAAYLCTTSTLPAAAEDIFNLPLAMSPGDTGADRTVRFYFGGAAHPPVLQDFGVFVANEKTNAVFRSDLDECGWVFQSALLRLQKIAHKLGANAVIGIHSYYKKEDIPIDKAIPCHAGFLMAGIALKGEMVRLGDK